MKSFSFKFLAACLALSIVLPFASLAEEIQAFCAEGAIPGCDGVCGSGLFFDECKICNGNNETRGCDGVCNSGAVVDSCGVCGGTGNIKETNDILVFVNDKFDIDARGNCCPKDVDANGCCPGREYVQDCGCGQTPVNDSFGYSCCPIDFDRNVDELGVNCCPAANGGCGCGKSLQTETNSYTLAIRDTNGTEPKTCCELDGSGCCPNREDVYGCGCGQGAPVQDNAGRTCCAIDKEKNGGCCPGGGLDVGVPADECCLAGADEDGDGKDDNARSCGGACGGKPKTDDCGQVCCDEYLQEVDGQSVCWGYIPDACKVKDPVPQKDPSEDPVAPPPTECAMATDNAQMDPNSIYIAGRKHADGTDDIVGAGQYNCSSCDMVDGCCPDGQGGSRKRSCGGACGGQGNKDAGGTVCCDEYMLKADGTHGEYGEDRCCWGVRETDAKGNSCCKLNSSGCCGKEGDNSCKMPCLHEVRLQYGDGRIASGTFPSCLAIEQYYFDNNALHTQNDFLLFAQVFGVEPPLMFADAVNDIDVFQDGKKLSTNNAVVSGEQIVVYFDDKCTPKYRDSGSQICSKGIFNYSPSPISLNWDGRSDIFKEPHHYVPFQLDPKVRHKAYIWRASEKFPLVVMDRNSNGVIDDGTELFGTSTAGKSYVHGFAALRGLDANKDSKLMGDELNGLQLWFDKNSDGVSSAEELATFTAKGVTELQVTGEQFDEKTGAYVLKAGYKRKGANGYLPMIDWFSSASDSEVLGNLGVDKQLNAKATKNKTAQNKVIDKPKAIHSHHWRWKMDGGYNDTGIITLVERAGGVLTGSSYLQLPVSPTADNKDDKKAAYALMIQPLKGTYKNLASGGKEYSWTFKVDETNETMTTKATVSADGLAINGRSEASGAPSKSSEPDVAAGPRAYSWKGVPFVGEGK
jgi:hypothetical protein